MMHAFSEEADVRRAAARLRTELEKYSYRQLRVTWGFPNGDRQALDSCVLRGLRHDIYVGFGEVRPGAISHIFKLVEHDSEPTDAFHPNAEVNVSPLGSRRVAGVLVADGSDVWLCHRGKFNAFRGPIKVERALSLFREFLVPIMDGDKEYEVIPVVALSSSTFVADLEAFVLKVLELKGQSKSGDTLAPSADTEKPETKEPALSDDPWGWNDTDEFEGVKTVGNQDGTTYEYRHGPLCNRLKAALDEWAETGVHSEHFVIRSTMNIDSAIVGHGSQARVIFEVKTSGSLSEQLYKAVGQLLYYRHKRGTPTTHLVLVLPGEANGATSDNVAFFSDLGIHVAYESEPGRFEVSDGTSIGAFLNRLLA